MVKEFEQRGDAILRRLPPSACAVEVGVFLGTLSEYLLQRRSDLRLSLVDSWLPAEQHPQAYRNTRDEHAHVSAEKVAIQRATALDKVKPFGARALVIEMASFDAAATVDDCSLDLVFLDADHSYEGVRADIRAWLPKVKPGGWIGGHDYQNPTALYDFSGVKRAVDEAFPEGVELDENFTWFRRC